MAPTVFDALNALRPRLGVRTTRDLPYGEGERGLLDVHAPKGGEGRPVVVFFYGGGWDSGHRRDYGWVGAALARQGFAAVVPDYRIHPHARWPDFLEDAAKAVRWARDNAARFGGDPDRMVLMGHSAGAYNAAMLAVDGCWLGAEGMDPTCDLRGWIGLSGPYDFLPLRSDVLKAIFGPEDQWPRTQPVSHVTPGAPPALLITGDRDKVVLPRNTDRLAGRLHEAGVEARVVHYPKLNHPGTVGVLAAPLRFAAPVMAEAAAFVRTATGPAGRARPSPAA